MNDVKMIRIGMDFFDSNDLLLEMMEMIPDAPLIGLTLLARGKYIAYTTENEPKLPRKYERQLRDIKKKVAQKNQEYLEIVHNAIPDEIDYHLAQQGKLIKDLREALKELEDPGKLDIQEISLMGNWPIYQNEDDHLNEEEIDAVLQQMGQALEATIAELEGMEDFTNKE